jgi:hypothetical protein
MNLNNAILMKIKKVIFTVAIILPPVLILFFVYEFGITIPYMDQWELVPLLEKMHNHTLTFSDLWIQHNEHRIFFPHFIMLFLGNLSNWNIFLELCTNIVLATLTFVFLLSILRNTLEPVSPGLKIFTSLMVFSIVQYENWIWGWQIQIFLSVLGSVIAIWAVSKWQGKWKGLIIAIPAAIVSSYSFNSGLATWPAILVVLLLQNKCKLKHIIIFTFAFTATILLYYYKYTKCSQHPPVLFFMSHPLIYCRYVLEYLGASLGWNHSARPVITVILLFLISWAILNLWRLDKQKLRELAPWVSFSLYACMAAFATGVGRAGLGWEQASRSRYTTLSLFLPLSAGVLLWQSMRLSGKINQNKLITKAFLIIILSMFAMSYINSYLNGIEKMKELSLRVNASAICLSHPQISDDDCLAGVYFDPAVVRSRIKILSELGIKFKTGD